MYGGLKESSLAESISAIYIILIYLTIKSKYYKIIFFLNGLSSSLAHSPFLDKNFPNLQEKFDSLDGLTIYFPLFYRIIKDKNEKKNIDILILTIILNYFIKINKFFEILSPVSIFYLILDTHKKINTKTFIYTIIALISKFYENEIITNINGYNIKAHTLWHIFGSHMFKELITLED